MATLVLYNAYLSVAGVDLSDHVQSLVLNTGQAMQDATKMGDQAVTNTAGLATWSLDVTFLQDYAASKVDATLEPLLGLGNTAAIIVNPAGSSTATANPKYSGTAILESYNPIGGAVGDNAVASATFQSAGDLTRATS